MSLSRYGQNNSNWKNAGHKVCVECGNRYHSYNKSRKYCSQDCYKIVRNRNRELKQITLKFGLAKIKRTCQYCDEIIANNEKVKTCGSIVCRRRMFVDRGLRVITDCPQCGVEFEYSRSAKRSYCSYKCHLNSGGATRAGQAAVMAIKNYGAKKDANHKSLVKALEKMGVQVIDTSNMGCGFPDLICCVRKVTILVEIKNKKTSYGKRGLNQLQREFAEKWQGGPVYVIHDLDEATKLANYELDSLFGYGGYDMLNVVHK